VAFVFDSTVGGASSNSYASVAEASDYFDGRLDAADWTTATTTAQQSALVMATRRLDTEDFVGSPASVTQALKFPRYYVPNDYGSWEDGAAIPVRIKHATYEIALAVLKDTAFLADSGLEAFNQVTIGTLTATPRHDRRAASLPAHVVRILRGLRVGGDAMTPVVRG